MQVDNFINTLREKGLNVTYQRILIYKYLQTTKNHPTAEEIYQVVKAEYPSISIATVYKTLETLAEHDLIKKVNPMHDLARFDGDTTPHHHLICSECRKIVDIHDERLDALPVPNDNGFQVNGYRVLFEGICQDCLRKITLKKAADSNGMPVTFCGKPGSETSTDEEPS